MKQPKNARRLAVIAISIFAAVGAVLLLSRFLLSAPAANTHSVGYSDMYDEGWYFAMSDNPIMDTTQTVFSSGMSYRGYQPVWLDPTTGEPDHEEYGHVHAFRASRGDDWVRVTFPEAGSLKWAGGSDGDSSKEPIPCDLRITYRRRPGGDSGPSEIAIADNLNYGFRSTNYYMTLEVEFIRCGTTTPINLNSTMWVTMGSINGSYDVNHEESREGFQVRGAKEIYVSNDAIVQPGQHALETGAIPGSYLVPIGYTEEGNEWSWGGVAGAMFDWQSPDFTPVVDGSIYSAYDFIDDSVHDSQTFPNGQYYAHTFWWRTGSVLATMHNESALYVSILGPTMWGVPTFSPLTGVLPPAPTKVADKSEACLGDTVNYTVTQPVGRTNSDIAAGVYYTGLTFTDTIPEGMTYTNGTFKVFDTRGIDVTNRAGSLSVSGQVLTYTFYPAWLDYNEDGSGLQYNGGNLTFKFATTINQLTANNTVISQFENVAKTKFNNNPDYERESRYTTKLEMGYVKVNKTSDNNSVSADRNGVTYTLGGAVYGVYLDEACTQRLSAYDLTTVANANNTSADSNIIALPVRTYWLKELTNPTGFNLDSTPRKVVLTVNTYDTAEKAKTESFREHAVHTSINSLLDKTDQELGQSPQGDADFKEAEYSVKYYDSFTAYGDSATPKVTATFKTSNLDDGSSSVGQLFFKSATAASGTWSPKESSSEIGGYVDRDVDGIAINPNENVLPRGTFVIQEVTPSTGYNTDLNKHIFQIGNATDKTSVAITKISGWNNNTAGNYEANEGEVFRGKVRVFKYDKEAFNDDQENSARVTQGDAVDSDGNSTFKGTTYKITNMSKHPVHVNGVTYAREAALPLIVASAHGEAVQEGLPYGTYTIEEVTPITGYLSTDGRRVPAWKRTFEIREDNQEILYDQYDPEDPYFRNLDQVIRGGLEIHKVDYDTRENWTQGDAGHATSATNYTFAKTTYTIWNRSKSYVYVNGYRYPKDTVCATIESDAQGIASLPNNALPYGTYEVYEENPSPGYLNSGWHKTFTIRQDGQVVIYNTNDPTDRANQDTHQNVNGDFHKNYEHVMRGDVIVNKLDWDTEKSLTTQGDAGDPATNFTFAGTTYAIKNVSRHPVYIYDNRRPEQDTHADHLYDPGEICLFIVTDTSGVARTTGKTLPYGSYEIYEYNPTTGYMNVDPRLTDDPTSWPHVDDDAELYDRVWHRSFTIDEDGDVIAYDQSTDDNGRLRNEEPVIRGGVEVHKVDADTGLGTPQGMAGFKVDEAYTFAGATYEITNESRHHVKVYWDDGSQRWVEAQGGVCGRIKADASGVARLDANALPYGTYTIREVLPPDGYRNSGWSKTFTVRRNNEIVKFDGTDTGNHQNQNTSDVVDADFKQNYEPVQRGGVTVSKIDAKTKRAEPQGDASLAGTVYAITNLSRYDVFVADENGVMHSYPPYQVCMHITSDADGVASTPADALPYGHYSIQEKTPPKGYSNSQWQKEFDIDRHRANASFTYLDNCNYEPIVTYDQPIVVRKVDSSNSSGAVGAATFAGTGFKIQNESLMPVLIGGMLHIPGETVMTLETSADGVAYIPADTFPVGKYTVTEYKAPKGYTINSDWSCAFEVKDDGTVAIQGGTSEIVCDDSVVRGDLRFKKVNAQTQAPIAGVAFRITSKETGESHIAVTGSDGVLNTSSDTATGGIPHSTNTNANDSAVSFNDYEQIWVVGSGASTGNGIWFAGHDGVSTPVDGQGALPYGTYVVEELRSSANRDFKLTDPFEIRVSTMGYADDGTMPVVNDESIPTPGREPERGSQVTVYKDSTPAPNSRVSAGDTITYKVSARNTGKDVAPRSLIRDYIPEGTEYVEGSASNGGVYVPASNPANGYGRGYVEWAIDDLLPRDEHYMQNPLTFQVKVLYSAPQFVRNTAYVGQVPKTVNPGVPGNPEPDLESNEVTHRTGDKATPAFVRVIKDSDPAPGVQVAWRSTIDYTLTVKNTGGTTATDVGVFDRVPTGTSVAALPSAYNASMTPDGTGVGWLIKTLDPGAEVKLKFTVRIMDREFVKANETIVNQASWGDLSNIPEATPPTSDMDNTTNIVEHPLYEVPSEISETYKTAKPLPESQVKNGDEIEYTLTTVNETSSVKPYVLVRDYIPEGAEYVEGSASDGGVYVAADAAGNMRRRAYVEWLLSDIRPAKSKAVTFKVKVTEDWRTYIRNMALTQDYEKAVTPGDPNVPEPLTRTNEVKHRTPTPAKTEDLFPLVTVTKSANPPAPTMVDLGSEIEYSLDVKNTGNADAYDVLVYDPIPEGAEWVSTETVPAGQDASAQRSTLPRGDGRGIGWMIRRLEPNESVTLKFVVKVVTRDILMTNAAGEKVIRNQAAWSYENVPADDVPTPPSSEDDLNDKTNVVDNPLVEDYEPQYGSQVTGYKDADPKPNSVVVPGSTIKYLIRCKHTGASPQETTLVRDYLPAGTVYVDGSASDGGAYVPADESASGQAYVEWVLPRMSTGDERTVSFEVRIAEEWRTYIRNHALTGPALPGAKPGDPQNQDPHDETNEVWHTTDENLPTPAVTQVVKDASPAPGTAVERGSVIRYSLAVSNTGGSPAYNTGVHDVVPKGLTIADGRFATQCHGTVLQGGAAIAWVVPLLQPGETITLWYEATVTDTAASGNVIQNQATWGEVDSETSVPEDPLGNTSNIVEHTVTRHPAPKLEKEALTKTAVKYGDPVEFVIRLRNEGDEDMTGWVLEDRPGEGLAYVSDTSAGLKQQDGSVKWPVTLAAGASMEIKVTMGVTTQKGGRLRNVAALYRNDGSDRLEAVGEADAIVPVMPGEKLLQTGMGAVTVAGAAGGVSLVAYRRLWMLRSAFRA